MTSTTSLPIPAASRAGTPAYSPGASAPRASDAAESRSFDELVSDEQHHDTPKARSERAEKAVDSKALSEPDDLAVEREEDDDDRDDRQDNPASVGALATPSLLQTLMAVIAPAVSPASETPSAPAASATTSTATTATAPATIAMPATSAVPTALGASEGTLGANPAENAATVSSAAAEATSGHAVVRTSRIGQPPAAAQNATPTPSPAATTPGVQTATPRGTGPAQGTASSTELAATPTAVSSPTAAPTMPQTPRDGAAPLTAQVRVPTTDKAVVPEAAPEAAGAVTTAVSTDKAATMDTSAEPPVSRLQTARGHAEKSAAFGPGVAGRETVPPKIDFVFADDKGLTIEQRQAGTRTAIPAATMTSSTAQIAQRVSESPVPQTASQIAAAGTETLSVDWKGWTNGGGERASTAAQFSQLGEKLSHAMAAAASAPVSAARVATPAPQSFAPAAPAIPVEVSEALAPIHSAIERLVLHGRDQLSLTVRFEQGGSLSIKLAMNQGEIATQIQTDVPGLEAALKSAWTDLAQDWNSRGWKLSNPEITSSTPTYHQRGDAAADDRQGQRQARQQADDTPSFGDRLFSPARLKHGRPAVTLSGLDALRAAALARRGIHTWA